MRKSVARPQYWRTKFSIDRSPSGVRSTDPEALAPPDRASGGPLAALTVRVKLMILSRFQAGRTVEMLQGAIHPRSGQTMEISDPCKRRSSEIHGAGLRGKLQDDARVPLWALSNATSHCRLVAMAL